MRVTIEPLPDGGFAVSFDYDPEITALLKIAVPSYVRRWDSEYREWIIDTVYPVRCFIEALRYRGHDIVGDPPDMPTCRECDAALSQHNLVHLCRECRLIAHNERLGQQSDIAEPVSHADAIKNVAAVLVGHPINDTANRKETSP